MNPIIHFFSSKAFMATQRSKHTNNVMGAPERQNTKCHNVTAGNCWHQIIRIRIVLLARRGGYMESFSAH